jgi:hypothetical protein
MTEIEKKALALVNDVLNERGNYQLYAGFSRASDPRHEVICSLIEQHEAYKQEVSDAVESYLSGKRSSCILDRFIISKPTVDPLAVALAEWEGVPNHGRGYDHDAKVLREALAKRGLKIVEIER